MSHQDHLARRYRRERVFIFCGRASVLLALLFLGVLLFSLAQLGWRTLLAASIQLEVPLPAAVVNADGTASPLKYQKLIRQALRAQFPAVQTRGEKKALYQLLSFQAALKTRQAVLDSPEVINSTMTIDLPVSSIAERYLKGGIDTALPANQRGITDAQIQWLDTLREQERTRVHFNFGFFTQADSRDAEAAGIGGALVGSFYTLLIAFLLSFPIGLAAAIYLEMFAARNRWFDWIEININNLAAVPSVIFGLLGLAVFINLIGVPRSSPLLGGIVLSLMTLPTIIIASRAALKSVSPSLLIGAMGLGATRMQGVLHHTLPAAMPGILTGTIIGMAGALGETAPLLMIGMVSFISDIPAGFTDAATALPVQIFLWADSPERGFAERSAAGILVLLAFLLAMNLIAIILRNKLRVKL